MATTKKENQKKKKRGKNQKRKEKITYLTEEKYKNFCHTKVKQ